MNWGKGKGKVAYLSNYHYICSAIRLEEALLLLFYLYTRKYD